MDQLKKSAMRVMEAWDETVLEKSRDGMMQERMEDLRAALAEQPADQEPPIAIVVDAYDTPGLQWLCQAPPPEPRDATFSSDPIINAD